MTQNIVNNPKLYDSQDEKAEKNSLMLQIARSFLNLLSPDYVQHPGYKMEAASTRSKISKKQVQSFRPGLVPQSKTKIKFTGAELLKFPVIEQSYMDLGFYSALTLHGAIVLFFILAILFHFHFSSSNFGNVTEGEPVDVMFIPNEVGSSGLMGDGLSGVDNAQTTTKPLASPPVTASLPSVPTMPEVSQSTANPTTEALPPIEGVEPLLEQSPKQSKPVKQKQINQPKKNLTFYHHYNPPSRSQPQRRQQLRSQNTSPFSNMANLDFSESTQKSKRQESHHVTRGSRSSIDLSTGPLVKNGKINVPYANKVSIRGVRSDYGAEIDAWIQRHMYYPMDAAKNGEEGSASVQVVLDRQGRVKSLNLTSSSGSDALDSAITAMFRNATLPPIPPDISKDNFVIDLTINYILIRH